MKHSNNGPVYKISRPMTSQPKNRLNLNDSQKKSSPRNQERPLSSKYNINHQPYLNQNQLPELPNHFPSNQCMPNPAYKSNDLNFIKEDNYTEEFSSLQDMWKELGVCPEYQSNFANEIRNSNEIQRKILFTQEKNSLKKLLDSLIKLSKEINNREKNIKGLLKWDNSLNKILRNEGIINTNNEDMVQEIKNLIKNIRKDSINIINHICKIREIASYGENTGKLNLCKTNKIYMYDRNYLQKMNEDVQFLITSPIQKVIDFSSSDFDTFLTNCSYSDSKSGNLRTVPVDEDMKKIIEKSRYVILQDKLLKDMEIKKAQSYMGNYPKSNLLNRSIKDTSRYNQSCQPGYPMCNLTNSQYTKTNPCASSFNYNGTSPSTFSGPNCRPNSATTYQSTSKSNKYFVFNGIPTNMSQALHKARNDLGEKKYDKLFLIQHSRPIFIEREFLETAPCEQRLKTLQQDKTPEKKIQIEREEVESMTREQFLKKLYELKKGNELTEDDTEERKSDDHSMSEFIEKNKQEEERRRKEEEEERRRKEEEEERKRIAEEEERRRKEEEEERKKRELREKQQSLAEKEDQLNDKERQLKERERQLKEREEKLNEREEKLNDKERQLKERENQLNDKDNHLKIKEKQVNAKENQVNETERQVNDKRKKLEEDIQKHNQEKKELKDEIDKFNKTKQEFEEEVRQRNKENEETLQKIKQEQENLEKMRENNEKELKQLESDKENFDNMKKQFEEERDEKLKKDKEMFDKRQEELDAFKKNLDEREKKIKSEEVDSEIKSDIDRIKQMNENEEENIELENDEKRKEELINNNDNIDNKIEGYNSNKIYTNQ